MKRSEMNVHQRMIFDIMCKYMSDMIGGCENQMADFDPDTEEYLDAKRYLEQGHEGLAKDIYDNVMAQCRKGSNAEHARFAGSEFLKERIERRLVKWGY